MEQRRQAMLQLHRQFYIDNFIANLGASYIRDLTVPHVLPSKLSIPVAKYILVKNEAKWKEKINAFYYALQDRCIGSLRRFDMIEAKNDIH